MKNIILFGASEFGKKILPFYRNSYYNILAFCDNDKSKYGKQLDGINIISPKEIVSMPFDEIIICSSFDDEISNQLINIGIPLDKIKVSNSNEQSVQLGRSNNLFMAEELMFFICELFNKYKLNYHIDHGTLLGIIREKRILPWDIDIDIAVLSNNLDEMIFLLDKNLNKFTSSFCKTNNWKFKLHERLMTLDNKEKLYPMVVKVFNEVDNLSISSFSLDIELKYESKNFLYWMVGSRKLSARKSICFPMKDYVYKEK